MNQELMKDELHRTLKRVIDQADEETLRFLINRGEMVLSELSVAKTISPLKSRTVSE